MADQLFEQAASRDGFQMQAWSSRDHRWEPMEEGAAASKWRPRPTAVEAVAKCLAWTGGLRIPSMQIIDLSTGRVVWRGLMDPFEHDGEWCFEDPDAGPPIELPDEHLARALARKMLKEPERRHGPATARPDVPQGAAAPGPLTLDV